MSERLLEVTDLRTTFRTVTGSVPAVGGVSFDLKANETLGIVGESGSGKTVLARTIMGLQPRTNVEVTGSVLLNGHQVVGASERTMRTMWATEVAMVFQDPMTSLNPVMRIGRQIDETLRVRLGMDRRAAHDRALELLTMVGIPSAQSRYRAYPTELSGGMRQRVVIATALACSPKLLIADDKGHTRSEDDARQDVATEVVSAEEVVQRRTGVDGVVVLVERVHERQHVRKDRAEHVERQPTHANPKEWSESLLA